ncbi:MAG TPA: phosphohistidine phosphatase SixA [Candidatus Methylomirabilis sp.]|nr:phosphohistidine phosphatase SixA [Candidatus Methylomirabilis sp.]
MELYILRHAIAVTRGTAGFPQDSERPLTDAGRAKLRRVVRGMNALGLGFDLILSSPSVRARQTAQDVASQMGAEKKLRLTPHLAPDGDPRALVRQIASLGAASGRILLVGHEPCLSELISLLVSGDARTAITLKKAGLCKLTVQRLRHGRCAVLEWLLTPGQMERIR